jgi:hypothetical protein
MFVLYAPQDSIPSLAIQLLTRDFPEKFDPQLYHRACGNEPAFLARFQIQPEVRENYLKGSFAGQGKTEKGVVTEKNITVNGVSGLSVFALQQQIRRSIFAEYSVENRLLFFQQQPDIAEMRNQPYRGPARTYTCIKCLCLLSDTDTQGNRLTIDNVGRIVKLQSC